MCLISYDWTVHFSGLMLTCNRHQYHNCVQEWDNCEQVLEGEKWVIPVLSFSENVWIKACESEFISKVQTVISIKKILNLYASGTCAYFVWKMWLVLFASMKEKKICERFRNVWRAFVWVCVIKTIWDTKNDGHQLSCVQAMPSVEV